MSTWAAKADAGGSTGSEGASTRDTLAPALEVEGLSKRFGRQVVLSSVSFRVPRGCLFGLFGDNGAGKTTLLRLLSGQLSPTAGRAVVLGLEVCAHAFRLRRLIGHLGQRVVLCPNLTLRQNLKLFGDLRGLSAAEARRRFAELCERLEIRAGDHQPAGTLPVGVQRRAGLAFALLHRPQVLLLDEPTSGIDGRDQLRLWEVLGEVAATGTTVVVTSHHPEEAEYCEQAALLHHGRLLLCGAPAELKSRHVGGARLRIEASPGFSLSQLRAPLESLGFPLEWSARPDGNETLRAFLPNYDDLALSRLRTALSDLCPGALLRVDLPSMEQVFREVRRAWSSANPA
ncbi:MAG: ABC transporter ATP-binding protein [Myxococcales bacterium]|nr:ABC transporter ATP-binding protein [Myxococcota bacterium]MDW8283257.1 ABC transporter ATP-binding protein [Myxococcales bacterium]